ncbi:glycosyltransferase family 4 protein [bacterium]|nr:glycosyltransferase family 4 protein [bacterium]
MLIINKFFFLNGGSEKVFFQERRFLIEQGIKVIDLSMHDLRNFSSSYSHYFIQNIDYRASKGIKSKITQGIKFIHSTEAVSKIERIIKKEKPDIAHLHNIYHHLTPSIIPVLKKHGVKIVLTLHDGKLICPSYLMLRRGEICTACEGRYFWKPVTKKCQGSLIGELLLMFEASWHKWKGNYRLVDLYIAPSRFIAELISRRIPEEKIRVLHNGVDTDGLNQSIQDEGYGLYFGRISKEKGIETLLKANKSFSDNMALKIAGTGPMEDMLRKGYPDVEFLGYKKGEELNEIISKSAFVVVPSECHENCSMVVLEAMSMGKPIIGSRIGGIPEQVEDGKTGFLFEMGNVGELAEKMKILTQNKKMRVEYGKAARKKVESEYSLARHCNGLLGIYDELLQK